MSESIDESVSGIEIVAIGGSAGSVGTLLSLAPSLTANLGVPVLVVIHRMRNEESKLGQILNNRLGISAKEAEEKEELRPGAMYIAPPNYHLLVEDDRTLTLADMELVKHSRPSIDVTFASVADVYRASAVGILLSGANHDGASGLAAIARAGGRVIAQDPEDAEMETMPQFAIDRVDRCEVMRTSEMRRFLDALPRGRPLNPQL